MIVAVKSACESSDIKIALGNKHKDDFFLTEVKSGSSYHGTANRILDAVAMKKSYAHKCITGYEIKVSRSDFTRDNKYFTYLPLVHALYMVCPTGLIKREELPIEIGLMWYDPVKKTLSVKKRPPPREIEISVDMLLYIIYSRLDGDRVPFYSSTAEYWRAWVEGKKSNDELAFAIRSKITAELRRLDNELRLAKRGAGSDEYNAVRKALVALGMPGWLDVSGIINWLNTTFAREYPECLDIVERQLNVALGEVKKAKLESQKDKEKCEPCKNGGDLENPHAVKDCERCRNLEVGCYGK
jgi:hypothetical protein